MAKEIDGDDSFTVVAKSIKNKTYLFDTAGRMQTGLYWLGGNDEHVADALVSKGSSTMDAGYYYFSEEDGSAEGQMITNKKMTIEIDGEDKSYYFKKGGEAYTQTIISGSVYGADGALITSYGDGSTYERIQAPCDLYEKGNSTTAVVEQGEGILINGNGKIKKSGTVTDINGDKVRADKYMATVQSND